ncbi:MAG TPA: hypothetical protein VGE97_03040 [Nitrososphaera sp.]
MKTIILSLFVLSPMTGAPSAFAQLRAPHSMNPQTASQSGFRGIENSTH